MKKKQVERTGGRRQEVRGTFPCAVTPPASSTRYQHGRPRLNSE